ncbi:hypothetical protein RN001_013685 [Aquatica leii]|uniref:Vitellogenin domain-containing protein n=1 Tax=Aquatica leii TaxID=1421715 RepID=A0AAN7Q018_9COLE|nr:hypothetical protein RN001_013685 [Aquatica leii]
MFLQKFAILWWIFFSRWWCLLYGFTLISSATESFGFAQVNIFEPGQSWTYDYQTSILMKEKDGNGKDVGFLVHGTVVVKSLWSNSELDRFLQFELLSPKLNVRSGKTPTGNGFMEHTSNIESYTNSKFFVHWSNGKIQKILLRKDEPLSLINMKKGIASLFQFQIENKDSDEIDASGHCQIKYNALGTNRFRKTKVKCQSSDLPYHSNPDPVLNTEVQSNSVVDYELDKDNKFLKAVNVYETHEMYMKVKNSIGNVVNVRQSLLLTGTAKIDNLIAKNIDELVDNLSQKESWMFTQESLLTEQDVVSPVGTTSFQTIVKTYRNNLKTDAIGSISSAKVIGKLVAVGKTSTREDIAKTIGSKKNTHILSQLYDILGIVQTDDSHAAVMKKLYFDDKKHEEFSERYLWSLSISPQPNSAVIKDLVNRYKKLTNLPDKIKETMLLTITAMAYKLSLLPSFEKYSKVYDDVQVLILNGLEFSKNEEKYMYLRALKNLKSTSTLPKLLQILKNGSDKECVLAWKAITSFQPSHWNDEILATALTTFFQMDRKHDSSSRTLALDVLLESNPSDKLLERLVYFLISSCKSYEVQQYMVQRLNMIGESNIAIKNKIKSIILSDSKLNNYAVLAEKGLSTALKRTFLESSTGNGTLIAIQEIKSGIVKRGVVDIVLETNKVQQELFRLGIFTAGLSSFVSSEVDPAEAEETATAGIELTVLGTQIRPFVFFNGQSELMGHVWSGTASEMTPAYQGLLMPYNHLQFVRLSPGFISEMDLKGSASFDLSGKVELSLWNRNGVSLIKKSAGIFARGYIRVVTPFVKSQVEFTVVMEPKFSLQTDLDFSSNLSLCMRLSQPDFLYRHNIYKTEKVPGSKHQLRRTKNIKHILPGKTYSLNKKNNEMCSLIFKN